MTKPENIRLIKAKLLTNSIEHNNIKQKQKLFFISKT